MKKSQPYYRSPFSVFRSPVSCLLSPAFVFLCMSLLLSFLNAAGQDNRFKPEPQGWFAGDIHVHRSCNGSTAIPADELGKRMEENDLAVISVLADMGNSEAPDRIADLKLVNGKDSPSSYGGRIIRYSAEWHWDADEIDKPHQALGGHLVLLGLDEAHKIWEESLYKILDWSKQHHAISGFAHMEYLNNKIPQKLNCCIPIDFPVETALGTIDFVSEDCAGSDYFLSDYYKLLNCGFRPGLAAGTDYPCNGGAPFGTLLTYVKIPDGKLSYRKWIEGIRDGKTVISRDGHNEFLDLKINGKGPGDEIKLKTNGSVGVEVKWMSRKELTGMIELICNGEVVATQKGDVNQTNPVILRTNQFFIHSGWICARRMDANGHQVETAPVYITVNNEPVRASADDALYFVKWIDNILKNIMPGGEWSKYYTHDLDQVQGRYKKARDIYLKIALEAKALKDKDERMKNLQ